MSLYEILSRSKNLSGYFQFVPALDSADLRNDLVQTTDLEEDERSKVLHVEVKELVLSEETRQLLVINNITFILKHEKTKVKHNF